MNRFLKWFVSPERISSLVLIVISFLILLFLRTLRKKYSKKGKEKGSKATIINTIYGIGRFFLLFAVLLAILQINGVNVTSLVAGLGIAGAIVGLALQDFLRDVIMGFQIIGDHYFSIGDCIEYNGREGEVLDFSLRTTKIGDLDDHSVTTIANRNISEIRRLHDRLDIDIPLSYDEDAKTVHNLLADIAAEVSSSENVIKCEYKGTQSFESSAVLYRIRVFCKPAMRTDVRRGVLMTVQNSLAEAGIKIPYNQLDVHIDKQ